MVLAVPADYPSFSSARAHLKDVFDSAHKGNVVTIARGQETAAVLSAEQLHKYFLRTIAPNLEVAQEDGRMITLMRGRPFVSEGLTVDDSLKDLVLSLREYAQDWEDHLSEAPNHVAHWPLVQLVKLSTDEELLEWFEHGGE